MDVPEVPRTYSQGVPLLFLLLAVADYTWLYVSMCHNVLKYSKDHEVLLPSIKFGAYR